jgi:hypothetical protein
MGLMVLAAAISGTGYKSIAGHQQTVKLLPALETSFSRFKTPQIAQADLEFGVGTEQLVRLCGLVTNRVIRQDLDHIAGVGPVECAQKIRRALEEDVFPSACPNASKLLKERLKIQALYDWIRTHFFYNDFLADPNGDRKIKIEHWTPSTLFRLERLDCVCAGYANSLVDMAVGIGLECYAVNGTLRANLTNQGRPTETSKAIAHKWVIFKLSDGALLPCDPTTSGVLLSKARELQGNIREPVTLPISREEFALYGAVFFENILSATGKPLSETNKQAFVQTYEQWLALNITSLQRIYPVPVLGRWATSVKVYWPYFR